ncbi:MAG: zinc ABC transporter substrate-binding protein [Actinomycetota bacterium]|nr:zinc ABC transporter substrate-binding protein [Actinomycetota bacterium]
MARFAHVVQTAARRSTASRRRRLPGAAAVAMCALLLSACSLGPSVALPAPGGRVSVVAAENFWGSIAAQLGGDRARVISIITNPNTDPHEYEPTAADARVIATAQLVIVNGIGYDPWATTLVGSDQTKNQTVLDVGNLLGIRPGGNPHRWYDPSDVTRVIQQITADYERIDPRAAGYFARQEKQFETKALAPYHSIISMIVRRYAGTPVGASESIMVPLARALRLDLITPLGFLNAVSEGNEPTAAEKATIDSQIRRREIKIYIYNIQNATPDVTAQVEECHAEHIPVVPVTETLAPADATFQAWQVRELRHIASALARAEGRQG